MPFDPRPARRKGDRLFCAWGPAGCHGELPRLFRPDPAFFYSAGWSKVADHRFKPAKPVPAHRRPPDHIQLADGSVASVAGQGLERLKSAKPVTYFHCPDNPDHVNYWPA